MIMLTHNQSKQNLRAHLGRTVAHQTFYCLQLGFGRSGKMQHVYFFTIDKATGASQCISERVAYLLALKYDATRQTVHCDDNWTPYGFHKALSEVLGTSVFIMQA